VPRRQCWARRYYTIPAIMMMPFFISGRAIERPTVYNGPTALGQFLRTAFTTLRVAAVSLNRAEVLQRGKSTQISGRLVHGPDNRRRYIKEEKIKPANYKLQTIRWTALSTSTDCLSSIGPLMSVQPDSGGTDPGAAVTRPDSDMTAGLHTVLAGCTLAFKSCDTGFFELVNCLMTLGTPG